MRRFGLTLFFLGFWLISNCEIIINEVFYDAIGNDNGKEWLELYNNGSQDINLEGWVIQSGGANFTDIYTFPSIVIRSSSFFLISEFPHPLANVVIELGFENGGTATDGIRIINPVNQYTDTILYDSPNSNNLVGDSINQLPCPPTAPGSSLARSRDGIDTNFTDDWITCPNPSPGTTNSSARTVRMKSCQATVSRGRINISTVILNLSTDMVDKYELSIKILFDSELKYSEDLSAILAGDSLNFCASIGNEFNESGSLEVELINNSDIHIVDNLWIEWISYQEPALTLTEILYYPWPYQTEWIEVKLHNQIVESVISIFDASGSEAYAKISGQVGDYLVIAEDKDNLLETFAGLDSLKVFQAEGWVSLNNNGDSLTLKYFESFLDSLNYENNSTKQGFSLEYDEFNDSWSQCCAGLGATPTLPNSAVEGSSSPNSSGIKIINNLISIKKAKQFIVNFTSETLVNSLEIQLFDIRGKELNTIETNLSNQLTGEYSWDGYLKGKYLASGLYPVIVKIKAENGRVLNLKKAIITINR